LFYIWWIKFSPIEHLLINIASYSGIIPISLFFFQKRKKTGLFFILIYLIASILTDILFYPIILHITKNEFLAYRIFTIIEYLLISSYLHYIIKSISFKKLILILSIGFIIFSIFDLINSKSNSFDSSPTGVACILILFYSIFYLFEKINKPDSLFLYSTPDFWIVVALIIFFSGTFFIYIFSQTNYNDPTFKSTFTLINASFSLLKNLMFSIAFLIRPEKSKQKIYPTL